MEILVNIRNLNCLYTSGLRNSKLIIVCKNPKRMVSTTPSKEEEKFAVSAEEDYESLFIEKESEISLKRNKSKLQPQHQNLINGKMPFDEPVDFIHSTMKYKARMFGRYGKQSYINPGTLWPNRTEINEIREFEKIAYPYNITQMVDSQLAVREEEKRLIDERQQKILRNLQKLETWKKDITARTEKKLADMAKAKAKKEALIEEVRRHFGYKVDTKDEKFKEMLLLKERAQKKKLKEEKSKAKQERLISELMKKETNS